jgi:hypothetical protein
MPSRLQERAAQRLVPLHQSIDGRLHELALQRAHDSERAGDAVRRLELREKPHPLLRVRQRQLAGAVDPRHREPGEHVDALLLQQGSERLALVRCECVPGGFE